MNHDDPRAVFRQAMPEATPPDAPFDLDRIVQDGYLARRRHRAVLGAAATTGVAAVAAVLALSVAGFPDGFADPVDPAEQSGESAAEEFAMSGYPYAPGDQLGSEDEREILRDAAVESFSTLLEDAGVTLTDPLGFASSQRPGNYGQTWLRSYTSSVFDGEDQVLRLEAMLPGGWTAEPGPFTQQLFPQHLISASGDPWYTDADWTDELVTTELDDGRRLITVDHECAYEIAVVYPNGSGLRATWDIGCWKGEPEYEVSLEDFTAAVTAMPEVDYDTGGLTPVDELLEVPTGWLFDPEWEQSDEALASAESSIASASAALEQSEFQGGVNEPSAIQVGMVNRGATAVRTYHGSGLMVYETPDEVRDLSFDLNYYLPGGWVPGIAEEGERGPNPVHCLEGFTCSETTDDDGTVWTFEAARDATDGQVQVTRFDPDGWAVSITVHQEEDAPVETDFLGDVLRAMPAPVYDEEEEPTVPEN
ncbi:hypothetical protein [Glycomyces harbinensis]|uniref:Uncharacterized protein n=1 Tax=Glycomyces harbinensis TaxID=58114 RepID=A0A1G6TQG3_9ACTN|nr:hypothetical protein [Glycomyces harbinensis]SDD31124.1 hypothetical protein SAMN05216270_10388 [Glycomyces harbinensis]